MRTLKKVEAAIDDHRNASVAIAGVAVLALVVACIALAVAVNAR
jgi:hypothetical protein